MALTPSHNNPGYHEVQVTLPNGQTVINTVQDSTGAIAYQQPVNPDGTRGPASYPTTPVKGDLGRIATPLGSSLYDPATGQPIADPTATPETPGEQIDATIKADPAYQLADIKRNVLDNLDPAHAAAHLTGIDPGKGLDNKINDTFQKAASTISGVPTTNAAGGPVGTNGPPAASSGGGTSAIDTSQIAAAAAASKAMQDKFLADYNAAHPGQPPVMSAAQLPPAVQATMPEAIRPGVATAAQLPPAVLAALPPDIRASLATASQLDPTMQAQQRDRQLGLESTIQDAIDGKAPSVAQLQLLAALQTNESNQLGLASKASGGGNVALALRTAANNTARLNQGASSDAAILRAKEIADARAQLGSVLDETRGSDISLADKNASLATGVSQTNAGLQTGAATSSAQLQAAQAAANAKAQNDMAVSQGGLTTDVSKTNATNTTAAAEKDAELQAQIAAANAKAQNDMAVSQGGLTNDASKTNVGAALTQEQIDAAAKQSAAANALTAGGQVIAGTVGAADAQAKAVAAAQAAQAAKDAKDASLIGAGATTAAAWLA